MNGLVCSGGGSKGAFQIGVLKYCAEKSIYSEGFRVVSGTSVGAINTAAVAMHDPGPEQLVRAVKHLEDVWGQLERNKDVWKLRFPPYVAGAFAPSVGKADALKELLKQEVDVKALRASDCHWSVSAVDLLSGELRRFTDETPDIIKAIMASGSFPLAFEPVKIGEGWYTDGGVRDIAPLKPAIDAGADKILVIPTRNPWEVDVKVASDIKSTWALGDRVIDLMSHELIRNDLLTCQRVNNLVETEDLVTKRQVEIDVIYPQEPLGDSLKFNQELINQRIRLGYLAAESYFEE